MATRYLTTACPFIPKDEHERLMHTKKESTSQSMEKRRTGLPVYLGLVAQEFGLTDGIEKNGIVRCSVGGSFHREQHSQPIVDISYQHTLFIPRLLLSFCYHVTHAPLTNMTMALVPGRRGGGGEHPEARFARKA
jgi:hypothetical protein